MGAVRLKETVLPAAHKQEHGEEGKGNDARKRRRNKGPTTHVVCSDILMGWISYPHGKQQKRAQTGSSTAQNGTNTCSTTYSRRSSDNEVIK